MSSNNNNRAPSLNLPITPRHGHNGPGHSRTNSMSNFSPQARDPNSSNNNSQTNNLRSPSAVPLHPNNAHQQQQQQQDPFSMLEDETEKSLHMLQQLRDSHRTLILKSVPEVTGNTRGLTAAAGGANFNSSNNASSSAGVSRPSALDWQQATVQTLLELDDITHQTEAIIEDVNDDLGLLKATVKKHVDGNFDAAFTSVDSDEVARRVEVVHAFERKLRLARTEMQNMQKARDFRQMQLGEHYEKASSSNQKGTKNNIKMPGGSEDDNNTDSRPKNEFASNYIKQEIEEQNRLSAQHAVILDQIHVGVISAEDKAKLINQSLGESEQKLGFVDKQIDGIQGKLDSAIQATNKLLENTSERNKMILICVLTVILVLLIFGLFSGNGSSAN